MSAYLKQWGLALSGDHGLSRVGNLSFTRGEAESLRDKWNKLYPAKPLLVINLNAE